ncbi:MAG: translation elongation factor Ts [Planctomycetota bacterium]|nr:translation elongation factor Ts [Planctomycetota bacterium]
MTTTISAAQVRDLRQMSGAPMMDCKKALTECGGDADQAVEWLRKKGIAKAAKKAGREATEGLVFSYIHHNNKVGVLLEVNCETDFVAATDDFKAFCQDVSMHIASMKPSCVRREDVDSALAEKERAFLSEQIDQSKPAEIQEKMLEGRMSKFYAEQCLLEQAFVKDDKKTIEQVRAETVGKLGENIQIHRFARFEIGA